MINALIAGERDPRLLAELAREVALADAALRNFGSGSAADWGHGCERAELQRAVAMQKVVGSSPIIRSR